MYLNLVIVSLLAAATARHLPENDGPHFVPPPMDFPRQTPLHQTPESHGTGVISDQGYGAAISQEKPSFDEFGRHERGYHNDRKPVYHEEPKFDELERRNRAQDKNFQENFKTFEDFAQGDQRTFDRSQDDRTSVQENFPANRNVDYFDLGGEDENKKTNCVQHKVKSDKTVTGKPDSLSVVPITGTRDNFSDTFKETLPKTNLNNNVSKNFPIDNEVTNEPFEGKPVESDSNGNVTDDRWIWGDTTTTTVAPPTETDLDNRAAFDGGQCPTGQVRIKGSNMCVDKDED